MEWGSIPTAVGVGNSYIKYSPGFLGRLAAWGGGPACGHDPEFDSTVATSAWEKRSPFDLTPPLVSMAREAFELESGYWWVVGVLAGTPRCPAH